MARMWELDVNDMRKNENAESGSVPLKAFLCVLYLFSL